MKLAEIFKSLSEDTRLRMLALLLNGELCVCDIESVLQISQANASRHLSKMKITGILTSRKTAQWVYYAINQAFANEHPEIIESLRAEFRKYPVYKSDMKTLIKIQKEKKDIKCREAVM